MPVLRKNRRAGMVFILITLFIDILGLGIIIPILPQLIKGFAGGDTSRAGIYVGMISFLYAVMQFGFAPILGGLSDRFGRRPIVLVSLFGLGCDYIIQGLAPSIGWLFVGRAIAGVMGASFTTANAYIADVSTPENRARNFGLVGVAFGMGFIFGPALGGLLGSIHLRLPFFASAALALINWLYGFFVLPESLSEENRSPFTWRKAHPFSSFGNLRAYPLVAGLATSFIFLGMAQRGLENSWVLYTNYKFGWEQRANGLSLALVGVTAAIVQGALVRPTIAKFGERKTILFGLSVGVLSYLGYALASRGWMMLTVIVAGSLGGVAGPAIQGLVAGTVAPSDQGKVQGAITSLMSLTSIVAPIIFTAGLFSYFTSANAPIDLPGAPFLLGAAFMVTAVWTLVRLFRRIPEQPGDPTPQPNSPI
ncbi:MAG: TCR/Tet family MFS transporter [Acidobacteriota bacterium]|nr:TCR/Tet family MFS transporter [Acidobacteriota bacterium]